MLKIVKLRIYTPKYAQYLINIRLKSYLINLYYKLDKLYFQPSALPQLDKLKYKLFYYITGRCGSLKTSHTPFYNNKRKWLHTRQKRLEAPYWINESTCTVCGEIARSQSLMGYKYEFTSEKIKASREKHKKDLIQPFRHGEASREFIEAHPERAREIFTSEEMRKAKEVWTDI